MARRTGYLLREAKQAHFGRHSSKWEIRMTTEAQDELPRTIGCSTLWTRLAEAGQFRRAILDLRTICTIIGAKTASTLPGYTDHSVLHMDRLWEVAGTVFLPSEVERFSVAEAFILGASFYVHDLGMALGATPDGRSKLEESEQFKSVYDRLRVVDAKEDGTARAIALQVAARSVHAEFAASCIDREFPGLDRYLIESTDLRSEWGDHIGKVAASHHWSLPEVEKRLGARQKVPSSAGAIDLGFLACALRVIDYAHINAQRAPTLERLLRTHVEPESLVHWFAQERISGPTRESTVLVFGSTRPIDEVDAWWTFFEMAVGLDREIRSVRDYLESRASSVGRFSLEGVKGIDSPQSFARFVQPQGFEPVDIRFRPDSMERLVGILGGRTLYGKDQFAPIRELLQNARDAIYVARTESEPSTSERIVVSVEHHENGGALSVADNGVGMSEKTIANYLLGIAADYWNSPEFFTEHPSARKTGFRQVGRFGIGFLSVFMLGDRVEVRTQRKIGDGLELDLYGVGRRGALRKLPQVGNPGTTVRIQVGPATLADHEGLARVVQAKAPMLDIPIVVHEGEATTNLAPQWWKKAPQKDFMEFVRMQPVIATVPKREISRHGNEEGMRYFDHWSRAREAGGERWPGMQPESITDSYRVVAVPGHAGVLLCSKGFAVDSIRLDGFFGMADLGDVELNAARSATLGWEPEQLRKTLLADLRPRILAAVNSLANEGNIPARYEFLASVAERYGVSQLVETSLPWIPIVEARGDTVLVSPAQLGDRLKANKEVIVVYGAYGGPWSCAPFVRKLYPSASVNTIIIPVSSRGGPDVGTYKTEDLEVEGDLSAALYDDDSPRRAPTLLRCVLTAIGRGWACEPKVLESETWIRRKRTVAAWLRAS